MKGNHAEKMTWAKVQGKRVQNGFFWKQWGVSWVEARPLDNLGLCVTFASPYLITGLWAPLGKGPHCHFWSPQPGITAHKTKYLFNEGRNFWASQLLAVFNQMSLFEGVSWQKLNSANIPKHWPWEKQHILWKFVGPWVFGMIWEKVPGCQPSSYSSIPRALRLRLGYAICAWELFYYIFLLPF